MKKMQRGHYLLDNGFEIYKDENQWVVWHSDETIINDYIFNGFDQCFSTLWEAAQYAGNIKIN